MDSAHIAFIAAAFAAGSFVFGASGFGFGLVTVPLLGIVLPIKDAIALQLPYAYFVAFAAAWHYREHLAWRAMWPLLVASLIALPLGVAALQYVPERPMKYLLAAFIVAAIALSGRSFLGRNPYAFGAVSGFFQGAFTTGGPPAMLYLLAACNDPRAVKGTNGLYFIFLYGATTALYAASGVVSGHILLQAAWFAPAVLAGGLLGYWAGKRLSFRQYAFLVNGLLVASAVLLAWRA
jgi:uncharacterized membrane protein YfcA